jgi:hypothetical protein
VRYCPTRDQCLGFVNIFDEKNLIQILAIGKQISYNWLFRKSPFFAKKSPKHVVITLAPVIFIQPLLRELVSLLVWTQFPQKIITKNRGVKFK